ncbi:AAA family ATPase [Phytohabitans sp. ZYX-F-186]|uniref:AAA family ATPase n=1 Tax=Phytohabitans maris TaxID=3071409 RepID=A0ABU0ZF53_9ACTN|nr:AAA family ATPase [Phytohabitans sp. ZYX-F-186]MDQ7904982.1 AAA family ATPase [Phytohabitans sp. ZYX-F-186]
MDGSLVGRDAVYERAWRALGAPGPVLLEGPAGIGKTAVWRALVAAAERAGWQVLTCAPTESEVALPFAALADLLRPLAGRVPGLPGPQRAAAEAVLLTAETAEGVADERAVGAATRSLLEAAGARVLVAVDDAPWLDPSSERALRYALRRLGGEIAVLVTCRTEGALLGLDDARLTRIALAPLGVGALHHVVRARLGVSLSRPLVARIARESGGNPLLAIELSRAVSRLPRPPLPGEELPVGSSLRQLLRDALAALPEASRDAVRRAALLTVPTLADLAAAGVAAEAFDAAEEAGLLAVHPWAGAPAPAARASAASGSAAIVSGSAAVVSGSARAVSGPAERASAGADHASGSAAVVSGAASAGPERVHAPAGRGAGLRVEFAHPMYAAAVVAGIPPGVRRRLHRTLADAVADPDERARQLARCTDEPDAAVAAELAAAADRQRARGAPAVAVDLYERAAALTPTGDPADRGRRRLAATRCRLDSGDYAAAGAAADAVATDHSGELRAEALLLRAMVAWCADDLPGAVAAGERGLAAAPAGTPLAGRIHAHLALFHDAPRPARRHAEAAIALMSTVDGDRGLLAGALFQLFFQEVRAGLPARTELLDRGLELEDGHPSWLAGTVPAIWWKAIDEHDRARERLDALLGHAVTAGDEPWQHELLTHLGEAELIAGRWDAAARHIAAARELGEQLGTGLVGETWLGGTLDAYRGRLAAARQVAEEGLRRAGELGDAWGRRIHLQLAGFVALSAGQAREAVDAYRELVATIGGAGIVEPLGQRFEPDWIEACVGAGDLDAAADGLARLAERHARRSRPWTALGLARSRVLVTGAAGTDPAAELAELAAARDAVPAGTVPLDRARCLLVAGMAHRRARRKREARVALETAAAEFAAIGAGAFEARARAELARIGGRTAAPTELTPTEERVARLAAQGRTNRAIADALYISPKTVEANLARVYRKLGIATRAELGAAIARTP